MKATLAPSFSPGAEAAAVLQSRSLTTSFLLSIFLTLISKSIIDGALATMPECPVCGASVQACADFSPWCDNCDWNLDSDAPDAERSTLEQQFQTISNKIGQSLLDSLSDQPRIRAMHRFWSPSLIAAGAISVLVLCVTLLLAASGTALLILGWPEPALIFLGVICIGLSVTARPRSIAPPPSARPLSDFPTLKKLVDDVAASLSIPSVDKVVITHEFNAWIMKPGAKQPSVLGLGLPLWVTLDAGEQVSLMAHELAHLHNGDPARGLLHYHALRALATWQAVLAPDELRQAQFWTLLGRIPFALISNSLCGVQFLIRLFICRDSQRCEFLADYRQGQVGGTDNAISVMRKLQYGRYVKGVCDRAYLSGDHVGKTIIPLMDTTIRNLPLRERERVSRIAAKELSRLDSSHPPAALRIALLSRYPARASLTLTEEGRERILMELSPQYQLIGGRLMNQLGYE